MGWCLGIRKGKKDKVIEKSFAMVKRILTLQIMKAFMICSDNCYLKYNVLNRNEVMEVRLG
jgi:hypothetical protein